MALTDAQLYERAIQIFDERRRQGTADITITESTESVFNRPARLRDLRRAVKCLPLEPLLAQLSGWSVGLARGRHPVDAVLQYRIAERLAARNRRGNGLLRRLAENPTTALVHEEQLAVIARMALQYSVSGDSWPSDGDEHLLEALLAFNSLQGAELRSDVSRDEWLLRQEVRASAVNSENVADILRRYGEFSKWAATPAARQGRSYLNLAALFRDTTELDYLEFAAATFAFFSHFAAAGSNTPSEFRPLLDFEGFCAQLRDDRVLRTWARLATISVEEARAALQGQREAMSIATLYPVMNTPLLELRRGVLACPALRYLPNIAGYGLLFRLCHFLERRDGKAAAGNLRSFYAEFLEWHVMSILMRASCNMPGVKIFPEHIYGRDSKRSSDIAVFHGSRAVFIDVNSKRFNTVRSIIDLDSQQISRDLQAMIANKVSKIDDRVADFRNGTLRYPGVEQADVAEVVGLVVTSQGMARFHGVNERLAALVPSPRYLRAYDFFDLNEVEVLENAYAGSLDLFSLIIDKIADPRGRTRSLVNYLYHADRDRLRQQRSNEDILNDSWFQTVLATARSWGLPGDVAAPG